MNNQQHISVIYIKSTLEKVWAALTEAEFTERYFHATKIESDWQVGSRVNYFNQDGSIAVEGKVLEVDAPNKLSITWRVLYNPVAAKEEPTRVTFSLDQVEDAIKLTVLHDQFQDNSVVFDQISEGWIAIICNMKTMLETDSIMAIS